MYRWILGSILTIILLIVGYFAVQYVWLLKTEKLPYRNLTRGEEAYYIVFNVENHDSIYTVVMTGDQAQYVVRGKSKFFDFFYSLYMNEVIGRNLCIGVDDSTFSDLTYSVVSPHVVNKFHGRNIRNDTTIVENGYLKHDLEQSDFNAIIYLCLKNGYNCWVNYYSGATSVSIQDKFIDK